MTNKGIWNYQTKNALMSKALWDLEIIEVRLSTLRGVTNVGHGMEHKDGPTRSGEL
jgi:hypothetical protein